VPLKFHGCFISELKFRFVVLRTTKIQSILKEIFCIAIKLLLFRNLMIVLTEVFAFLRLRLRNRGHQKLHNVGIFPIFYTTKVEFPKQN
jgi:hypothetical protein